MAASEPISNELAYPGLDCDLDIVNAYYVGVHAITEHQFDLMRKAYFQGIPVPDPRRIHAQHINPQVSCIDFSVHFFLEETNTTDNDEIIVEIKDERALEGKYSIHFFRGLFKLFNLHDDDIFEFSKAKTSAGNPTLTLRVLRSGSLAVLYHGDLTNMYP